MPPSSSPRLGCEASIAAAPQHRKACHLRSGRACRSRLAALTEAERRARPPRPLSPRRPPPPCCRRIWTGTRRRSAWKAPPQVNARYGEAGQDCSGTARPDKLKLASKLSPWVAARSCWADHRSCGQLCWEVSRHGQPAFRGRFMSSRWGGPGALPRGWAPRGRRPS